MSRKKGQSDLQKTIYTLKQFITAINDGDETLVKSILGSHNFDLAKHSVKILKVIITKNNVDILNLLIKDNRINFTAGKHCALKIAAQSNQHEIIKALLESSDYDDALEHEAIIYNILKKSAELGHYDIATIIINTKIVSFDKILKWAIFKNHVPVVEKIFEIYPAPNILSEKFVKDAIENNANTDLLTLLVNSNRFDLQKLLPWAVEGDKIELVRAILSHPDSDPSYENNRAIRHASCFGHTKIVELLLTTKDKGIDPNVENYYCLSIAASKGHADIVRLLMPYYVIHREKLTNIINIDSPNISEEVTSFITHPESYVAEHHRLSSAQKMAFAILQLKHNITEWEKEQRKALAEDPENAMQDETVTRAKLTYENKVKPAFTEKFLAHAELEIDINLAKGLSETAKLKVRETSALIKIEQNIRALILDTILASNPVQETTHFINLNKEQLIIAADKELMKTARNLHFNTGAERTHLAWRGYDADAPCKLFCNLLTEPTIKKVLFTTAASTLNEGALYNTDASFYIRKMVAHYFLLVNDINDGIEASEAIKKEIIQARRANFISELADLRSAHSNDFKDKTDAPSCYPGYLSRIANMGYAHPLTKQTVTTKMFIKNILEPHIFTAFKKQLETCQTELEGQELLEAVTLLSETGWRAQNIFLGLEKYDEKLIKIRGDFIRQLDTQKNNLIRVNAELEKSGRFKLTNSTIMNEQCYIFQYLLDPARANLSGKFSHEYNRWVQKFYPVLEQPKEKPEKNLTSLQTSCKNPYTSKASQIQGMLDKNITNTVLANTLSKRLTSILTKESMFNLIYSKLIFLPIFNPKKHDPKSYGLFTEALTEVLFEADQKEINQLDRYLTKHVWNNLDINLNQTIETKLGDYSEEGEFAGALAILNEMATKHLEAQKPVYTPQFNSILTPPPSPSKDSPAIQSPSVVGRRLNLEF